MPYPVCCGEFVINDSDERAAILSQPINLAVFPPAQVSLMLNASETSEGSNFDAPATFSAWVEVIDSAEKGWRIDLVNGGLDTDGNRWLTNEEFAPGAEDTELLDINIPLSAQLPADAVTAQIVIVGAAGSGVGGATDTEDAAGVLGAKENAGGAVGRDRCLGGVAAGKVNGSNMHWARARRIHWLKSVPT